MPPFTLPSAYARVRRVASFEELLTTPFADGVNALCWERPLTGDFGGVMAHLDLKGGITALHDSILDASFCLLALQIHLVILSVGKFHDHNKLSTRFTDEPCICRF